MRSNAELEFFNSLSARLVIDLTVPAEPIPGLQNLMASPDSRLVKMELRAGVINPRTKVFRPLTSEEFDSAALRQSSIRLRGEAGEAVSHAAPNGSYFTVGELLKAVEETERQTRMQSEWLGGIDIHHVFFEGVHRGADGVWEIDWGS